MPAFTTTRRVEFCDTDMAGIVHFSNFFRYMEAAETEFLRSLGLSVTWAENGVRYGFPRVSVNCDYASPARFEDVLSIAVVVEKIGTKSVSYRYDFHCGERAVAIGRMTAVYCKETGHGQLESAAIPDELRMKLEA
jgi:YbgC/YbaW family acyl-CoA thioester hydrolase